MEIIGEKGEILTILWSGTRMRGKWEQEGNIPNQAQTGVDGNGVRTQFWQVKGIWLYLFWQNNLNLLLICLLQTYYTYSHSFFILFFFFKKNMQSACLLMHADLVQRCPSHRCSQSRTTCGKCIRGEKRGSEAKEPNKCWVEHVCRTLHGKIEVSQRGRR